jgi:protein-disulfide isomerase
LKNQPKLLWGIVALNVLFTAFLGYTVLSGSAFRIYIEDHPKEIMDSVQRHMETAQADANESANENLKANQDFLLNDPRHPFLGNPKGDVTIVEFLDYNCGYCKKAYPSLEQLIAEDKDVRVVLIELPILHETSALAARWALAAHDQGGYAAFHKSLMEHRGPITEEVLTTFATAANLDVAGIKAKADSPEVSNVLAENAKKSMELNIQGTPGFIIGENVIRGFVELPVLKEAVKAARDAK